MNLPLIISLSLLVYMFFGYPLSLVLLVGLASLRRKAITHETHKTFMTKAPSVTLLLSVYNEAEVISRKLDNYMALRYPRDKLSLVIVSDGSDDGTDWMISTRACPGVTLIRQEGRKGKTAALNLAVHYARGDLLLFTDADSMLAPDSVSRLAEAFADPDVGVAGGRSMYLDDEGHVTEGGLYRCYEEWIKRREGLLFGIAGADGAIYAMRRNLYTPLPSECINDLVHPLQAVMAGKKAVAVWEALALETRSDHSGEFARQTRIMAQSWLICLRYALPLLRAGKIGYFWQFLSHKPLRWLAMPLLLLTPCAAAYGILTDLHGEADILELAAISGVGLLAMTAAAGAGGFGGKAARMAWLFVLQSMAALAGLIRLMRGERFITWSPRGR